MDFFLPATQPVMRQAMIALHSDRTATRDSSPGEGQRVLVYMCMGPSLDDKSFPVHRVGQKKPVERSGFFLYFYFFY